MPNRIGRIDVEGVKDPDNILFPSGNLVLIASQKDGLKDCLSFSLFNDPFE